MHSGWYNLRGCSFVDRDLDIEMIVDVDMRHQVRGIEFVPWAGLLLLVLVFIPFLCLLPGWSLPESHIAERHVSIIVSGITHHSCAGEVV